jgi:amidase
LTPENLRWAGVADIEHAVSDHETEPQHVVDAHLDAIKRFDPRIHAYVHVDWHAQARRTGRAGSLDGVTLAVKDSQPVAGMPWTYATPSWKDRIATEDAIPVARAKSAGMTVLGKTNLPELAAAIGTTNTLFPPTHNPWREGITPGGSSGGSAAAVAAGMTTVALGEDMGGSIRIPASCCGVVGLRPTPDRVPTEMIDAAGLSSRSALGRTVDDVRWLYAAATLSHWHSSRSTLPVRVGIVESTALGADPACLDAVHRAAAVLEMAGHKVERIDWDPEPVTQGYAVVRRASMASFPADLSTFGPGIRNLAEQGRDLTVTDYFRAFESATAAAQRAISRRLEEDFHFLLTPTLGLLPMPIEEVPPFLGEAWARYVQFVLPVSFARVPAMSIPAGLSRDGLPVGVQLVGRFAEEFALMNFAEMLEEAPGFGFQQPPGLE